MVRFGEVSKREGARGARGRRIDRGRDRRTRLSLEPLEGLVLLSTAWAAENPGAGTLGHGRAVEVLQNLITSVGEHGKVAEVLQNLQGQTPTVTVANDPGSLAVQDKPTVVGPVNPRNVPPPKPGGENSSVVVPPPTAEATTQGINVRDFGAKGDGLTDDKAAIESAIRAAVESGVGAVYFPAGTYRVQLTGAKPGVTDRITIPADLKIQGSGRNPTTIQFDPASRDFDWSGFRLAADFTLEINDLTLRGPDQGARQNSTLIHREGPQTGVAYDAAIRLHRVDLAGEAGSAIIGDSGTASPWTGSLGLELVDCDVTAWVQTVSWFCGYTDENALHYLHASRTRFHDAGLTADDPLNPKIGTVNEGQPIGHLVYVHPNTSLDIEDCHFDNAQRYAIHWYGQSPVGAPRYARILRCDFGPGVVGTAILTTDRIGTTTLIEDCAFHNAGTAIQTRSAMTVRRCEFAQGGLVLEGQLTSANSTERAATVVLFEDSTIEGGNLVQPFAQEGSSVTIRRCVFRGRSQITNPGVSNPDLTPSTLRIIDCDIDNSNNLGATWVQAYSGNITIQGCTLRGAYATGAINFDSGARNLTILDNDFQGYFTKRTNRLFHTNSPEPVDPTNLAGSGNTYRAEGFSQLYWNEKNGFASNFLNPLWEKPH